MIKSFFNELVFTIHDIIELSFTDERTVAVGGAIRNETGHWKGPWLSFFWCTRRPKLKHFLFFYYRLAVIIKPYAVFIRISYIKNNSKKRQTKKLRVDVNR